MYEVPQWAKQGWIDEVGTTLQAATGYDSDGLLPVDPRRPQLDGKLYAAPFYGESSSLFYRKDLLDAAGVTLSDQPTWDEVATAAKALHKPDQGQYGICLRGLPGWGEMGAPLGTVINTFGGRWYDKDWKAQTRRRPRRRLPSSSTSTGQKRGRTGLQHAGFTECETLMTQGKVAMWYDATSAPT